MTIRSWVNGYGTRDEGRVALVFTSKGGAPLPLRTGRIACLVLALLFLAAGLGIFFSGKDQMGSIWLFLLGGLCLWISAVLRPPRAL